MPTPEEIEAAAGIQPPDELQRKRIWAAAQAHASADGRAPSAEDLRIAEGMLTAAHLAGVDRYQETGTVNYPNDYAYTRITEFKQLTGQVHAGTSIVREYPQAEGDPYYPVPRAENEALFKRYEAMARNEAGVTFVGRLAQYRYYNMDQVVGAALAASRTLIDSLRAP